MVDLTYRNSLLHGVVGSGPIRIAVAGRPNRASYAGTCSGHDFVLDLQVGSNHRNLNPTTELRGSYDGAPVELSGAVHLTSYFALRHVDITGTIGDHRVTAVVASVEAPASGPAVLSIDGHFDDAVITAYAAVGPTGRAQRIEGLVGGQTMRLTVDTVAGLGVHIGGEYAGPPALLGLLVGALTYFS